MFIDRPTELAKFKEVNKRLGALAKTNIPFKMQFSVGRRDFQLKEDLFLNITGTFSVSYL